MLTREMLSEEQSAVLKQAADFLLNKKRTPEPVFLTGQGGSGKSSVLQIFLEDCFAAGFSPILTAPTHVARERLLGMHPDVTPITIQSFMSYSAVNHAYGDTKFGFTDKQTENSKFDSLTNILILDESSMLTDEFVSAIIEKTKGRVLFVGDIAQIPPVVENDFDRTRILTEEECTPGVIRMVDNVLELTKCFRQNEASSLFHVCTLLRESIFTGECLDYYHSPSLLIRKMDEIIKDIGDKSVYTNIKTEKIPEFLVKSANPVFLAYGNPTVNAVQRSLPEWYKEGGKALTNGPVLNVHKDGIKLKTEMVLGNNTHVKIQSLEKKAFDKFGVMFDSVIIDGVQALVPSDVNSFDDAVEVLKKTAKLNEKNSGKSSWDEETSLSNLSLSRLLGKVVILRDARTSTVHRAQGSQWQKSIVSLNNILFAGRNMNQNNDKKDVFRKIIAMKMLYTAFSRAKDVLIINQNFDKRRISNYDND